jgi:hypothetical protein
MRCDKCEAKARLYLLERPQCVALLEGISIACFDDESVSVLQEAIYENIEDGTLDPQGVLAV